MKILRKLFSKKEEAATEKKIAANEKALKKRNIKRGVGAAIGVGLSAYAGNVAGGLARGIARENVFEKGAKDVGKKFINTYKKVAEKAKSGNLTEHEAEFLREATTSLSNPILFKSEARRISRNSREIRKAADKIGKKAKIGVGLAVGGGLAAHQIAATVKAAKEDRKKTDAKNEKAKQFTGREKVPQRLLKEAKNSGVVQKDSNGDWRIISLKAGEFWDAKYKTKEKAEAALAAYHANKH